MVEARVFYTGLGTYLTPYETTTPSNLSLPPFSKLEGVRSGEERPSKSGDNDRLSLPVRVVPVLRTCG